MLDEKRTNELLILIKLFRPIHQKTKIIHNRNDVLFKGKIAFVTEVRFTD
jgi:hypothetical protein